MKTLREAAQMALEAMTGYRRELDMFVGHGGDQPCDAERALSAALEQPEQEPVAYDRTELNAFVQDLYDKKMREGKHGHYETMFHVVHRAIARIYTTPPQREWQGLTEEDLSVCDGDGVILARYWEAKLREKNNG